MATQVAFGPRFHPKTAPVTFWYIAASIAVYLGWILLGAAPGAQDRLFDLLGFRADQVARYPWTVLTFPLLNAMLPWWFAISMYWSWWLGTTCEQWWGSRVQAGFMVAMSLGMAAGLALGTAVAGGTATLLGGYCLIAGWVTIVALRGPTQPIILIVVPVPMWLIALLTYLTVLVVHSPVPGLAALLGTAGLAAAYHRWGHHLHRFLGRLAGDPGQRAKRREARDRDRKFQRLMKRSGLTDVDKLDR